MLAPPHSRDGPAPSQGRLHPVRAQSHHREGSASFQRRPRPTPLVGSAAEVGPSSGHAPTITGPAPPARRPRPARLPRLGRLRRDAGRHGGLGAARLRSQDQQVERAAADTAVRGRMGEGRCWGLASSGSGGRARLPEDFPEEEAHPGSVRAGPRSAGLHPDPPATLTSFPRPPREIRSPSPAQGPRTQLSGKRRELPELGDSWGQPLSLLPQPLPAPAGRRRGRGGWGLNQLVGRRWRGTGDRCWGSLSEATGARERVWEKAQIWGGFITISGIRSPGNLF